MPWTSTAMRGRGMLYSASVPEPASPPDAAFAVFAAPDPPKVVAAPASPVRAMPSTFVELMLLDPSFARDSVSEDPTELPMVAGALLEMPMLELPDPLIPVEPVEAEPVPTPFEPEMPEPAETPDVEDSGGSVEDEDPVPRPEAPVADPVADVPPRPLPEPLAALEPLEIPEDDPPPEAPLPVEPPAEPPPDEPPPPDDCAKAGPAASARERARVASVRLIVIVPCDLGADR